AGWGRSPSPAACSRTCYCWSGRSPAWSGPASGPRAPPAPPPPPAAAGPLRGRGPPRGRAGGAPAGAGDPRLAALVAGGYGGAAGLGLVGVDRGGGTLVGDAVRAVGGASGAGVLAAA